MHRNRLRSKSKDGTVLLVQNGVGMFVLEQIGQKDISEDGCPQDSRSTSKVSDTPVRVNSDNPDRLVS